MPYDPRLGYDPNSVAGYEELPHILVTPTPSAPPAGPWNPSASMFDPNQPFALEGGVGHAPQPAAPGRRDWAFGGATYGGQQAGPAGGAGRGFGAPMLAPWTPAMQAPPMQQPAAPAPAAARPPAFAPSPAEWSGAFDEAQYRPQPTPPKQQPWWPEDMLWSGLGGAATGLAYAAAGRELAARLAMRGLDWTAAKVLPADWADAYSNTFGAKSEAREDAMRRKITEETGLPFIPSPFELAQLIDRNTYKPQTVPGEYTRTMTEFAPAALVGQPGVGTVRRIATQAVAPALVTETVGQLTKGTPYEGISRVLAGIASAFIVPGMASRVVTPFPTSAERRQMGDLLLKEGIDVSGGQYTGSPALRNIESTFNPAADQALLRRQRDQFSASMLQRGGVSGNRGAREAIETSFGNIDRNRAAITARNTMIPDATFGSDVTNAVKEYYRYVGPANRAPILDEIGRRIVLGGQYGLTGPGFDELRAALSKVPADPQLASAFGKIRTALDDAMERSIVTNNPADATPWRQALTQERNLKVIEKAIVRGGEAADAGTVSHSKLYNAMNPESGPRFERYAGDPYDVTNAAETILRAPPANDHGWRGVMTGAAAAGSGAIAGGLGGGIPGVAVGAMAPAVIGQALLSPAGRLYLRNQLWANQNSLTPAQKAFMLTLFARDPATSSADVNN